MGRVIVHIPPTLRDAAHGKATLEFEAFNLKDLLADIRSSLPELYRRMCDESGSLRKYINLSINCQNVRGTTDRALHDGDVVAILTPFVGG